MKKISYIILSFIIVSCSNQTGEIGEGKTQEQEFNAKSSLLNNYTEIKIFGNQEMTKDGKITTKELLQTLSVQDSAFVKVEAVIKSICQKKGCWMYVDIGDENEMLIRFKDYGFFVPMEASGDTAIIEGLAKVETLSVEWLKHLKEDANATQEEIDAITEPETIYSISEATGVMIY